MSKLFETLHMFHLKISGKFQIKSKLREVKYQTSVYRHI